MIPTAALTLTAIIFGLVYVMTRLGPLAVAIRALMHLQAALLGARVELLHAARRWRRLYARRLEVVQQELAR